MFVEVIKTITYQTLIPIVLKHLISNLSNLYDNSFFLNVVLVCVKFLIYFFHQQKGEEKVIFNEVLNHSRLYHY